MLFFLINIKLNPAELAEWDEDLLGKEMQEIINIDMSQFGFSIGEDADSELFIYIGSLLTHLKFERYIKEKSIATMGDSILVNLDF